MLIVVGALAITAGLLNDAIAAKGCGGRDKPPPTITFGSPSPGPNVSGWNNTDVTIPYTVQGCRVVSGSPASPFVFTSDGANQSVTVTACDKAGNCATAVSPSVSIDKTPPSLTESRSPLANEYGWNNTDVIAHFDCNGDVSGVASLTPDTVLSEPGANQSVTGTCVDNAGNSASATVSGISIDKGIPVLNSLTVPETIFFGAFFSITATATDPAPASGFTESSMRIPEWSVSMQFLHNFETDITDVWTQRATRLGAFTVKWAGLDAADNLRDPDVVSGVRLPDAVGAFAGAFLSPVPNSKYELGTTLPIKFRFVDVNGIPQPQFCGAVVVAQAPVQWVLDASWDGSDCQVVEELAEARGYRVGPVNISLPRADDAVLGYTRSITVDVK